MRLVAPHIRGEGFRPLPCLLQLLRRMEHESFTPGLDPLAIRERRGYLLHHLLRGCTRLQLLAAGVQRAELIDLRAPVKRPRPSIDVDALVAIDAQIREDEFGPVLAEVAEEHDTQPLAQGRHAQTVDGLSRATRPDRQRMGGLAPRLQMLDQLWLGCAAHGGRNLEQGGELRPRQQTLQLAP